MAYVRRGDGWAVGALNLGSDHTPAWCLNLQSDPTALVEVGGTRRAVRAREAEGVEAERLWGQFVAQLSTVAHSRELAQRHVPMMVLEPALGQRVRAD